MQKNRPQGPASRYSYGGHISKNINKEFQKHVTTGQRVADWVAKVVGSWPFIIYQSILIIIWLALNSYLAYMIASEPGYLKAWDPYPFILLNLLLSFQAAYTGPVVMMSQNRQAEKDRLMAEHDYAINKKAEEEIKVLLDHLVFQDAILQDILDKRAEVEIKALMEHLVAQDAMMQEILDRLEKLPPHPSC